MRLSNKSVIQLEKYSKKFSGLQCMYMCVCVCVCVCVCLCVCVYETMCVCTYAEICMHDHQSSSLSRT